MRTRQLFRAIGDVDSDLIEEAETARRQRLTLRLVAMRWGAVAACLAVIAAVGLGRFSAPATPPDMRLIQQQEALPGVRAFGTLETPAGPRKILHWNGYRYAFLQDGAIYNLSEFHMEKLGELSVDMLAGQPDFSEQSELDSDGATTWAVGGGVYAVEGYNPAFRLAVEENGRWYLADLVARVDDTPLETGYFFEVSDLENTVSGAEILPHSHSDKALHRFAYKDAVAIVKLLSGAAPATLTGEQYEALARAQSEGRSWRLRLVMGDSTFLDLFVQPDLGLVFLGDSCYHLPDKFLKRYGPAFDNLPEQAPPMQ